MDFVGGYTTFTGAYRERGERTPERVGGAYKDAQAQPGPWGIYMYMQGETIPKESNHVRLHPTQKDQWGIPLLVTSVGYDDNDERMIRDWRTQAKEMLEVAGCRDVETRDNNWHPASTSTRWAAAAWGAIRRRPCSTAGTSCTPARTSSSPTAPA